jgi:uncharacterized membrane protein
VDPARYDDWRLASLSPLPGWALALLAAAAAASVLLAARGLRTEPDPRRRALLVALRAASALLALFLVAEPAVQLLQTARVRQRFAILVDASRSMAFPIEPGGPARHEAAAALLASEKAALARLAERVDLEWWTFAGDASPADAGAAAAPPRGSRTDLLPALRAAAAGSRRLAGALVLSDGTDNGALGEGIDGPARAELRALGFPVNVVAVGIEPPRDLAVERIAVDDFAFVRSTVTVEATLRARGYGGEEVELLLKRDGAVVASARQRLEPGRDRYAIPLSFAPDSTGTFRYTLEVRPLPGEAIAANNLRTFSLRVIRDRVRVLLVAGRPCWEERFLRGLLKQDPNVDLVSFFILRQGVDNPGPQEELSLIPFPVAEIFGTQLKTFDAVLFVDFAWSPYRSLQIESYLPGIRDYVLGGGAFAMVGGEQSFGEGRYGETALAEILPVQPLDGARPSEEEFTPRPTPEGRQHPVTRLVAGDGPGAAAWETLPRLPGLNRVRRLPPGQGATVLLEAPAILVEGQPAPVVAVREVGRGRSLAVTTDSTWYWGFLAAESGRGGRAHQRFWVEALRWLVRDTDAEEQKGAAPAPSPEPDRREGWIEDSDAAPRPELLRAVADLTGGRRAALPDGRLPELALRDPERIEIGRRKDVPIWDRAGYLAALAATLAAEWILRRRFGWW